MKRKLITSLIVLMMVVGLQFTPQSTSTVRSAPIGNNVLAHALDIELGLVERAPGEQLMSSGVVYTLLEATGELENRANASALSVSGAAPFSGPQTDRFHSGNNRNNNKNIRVNQDLSLRRQAEEVVVVNPTNPKNLIAGQNDSRIGYNHCGYDFSFDSGKTWGDLIPPFWSYVLPDGHTADACSDPTATFDTDGNAYVGGVIFDVASYANAIVVVKSNAGIGGSYYHSPASGPFQEYGTDVGVVASGNDPNVALDKEFIVADASKTSPKRNNVYATWTQFEFDTGEGVGGHSPIYFSQSTDGGATWSDGVEISGSNAALCADFSGEADPNACDQDQGSHPIVGQDGTIYVAFGNGNTPVLGINQHLIVSCPASADCSQATSWTAPSKISDDYGTQPVGPDATTGCSNGRQCLPPNGYRMDDFVEGSISVDKNNNLYAVWADFRNGGATCDWNGGANGSAATATPPCDNDVFYSFSTDGGATWSAAFKITPAGSAQWMPWSAVAPDGKTLWVAYYDRKYGNCEFTGCNDITLAEISNPTSHFRRLRYQRLTSSSMPNLVPANNPVEAGFLGDYMWVTVDAKGTPYVVWADTRGQNGTVEEDIYFYKGGY
jgi:hypothetical protein